MRCWTIDSKGMSTAVAAELERAGGFWGALLTVLPALKDAARVTRHSTSAGLSRADTGEALPGSDGIHVYVAEKDGADSERFLRALHDRCWLAGLGWMIVSTSGALLERSIVDRMVGGPERLVFEGGPVLVPPLQQDKESRRPIAVDGVALDTVAVCPPLSIVEQARLDELKARERERLAPEMAKAREAFVEAQARKLVARTGMSEKAARQVIVRQCEGVLRPDIVLPFDDPELAGSTVGDVLADPELYEGETLADPLEGVAYGRCVAKIMRRADGTPWIHSFARGRTIYELKHDAASVRKAMEQAAKDDVVATFAGSPQAPTSTRSSWRTCVSWRRSSPASACGRSTTRSNRRSSNRPRRTPRPRKRARPPTGRTRGRRSGRRSRMTRGCRRWVC